MGQRLAENAPRHHQFQWVKAICEQRASAHNTDWENGRAIFVARINEVIKTVPEGGSLTVLVRSVDGLTTSVPTLESFLEMWNGRVKLQIVFQCNTITAITDHPRLDAFRGLGSVMAFTGD